MCKGLIEASSAKRNTASTKWLMKVSQQLIDGEWPIEQSVNFDGSAFPSHAEDSATEVFLSSVERNGELKRLRMSNVSLDIKLLALFQRALVVNQELSSLELCNVRFVDADMPKTFFTIAGIEELSITRCTIQQEFATSVGQCIRSGCMKILRLLHLSLDDECAQELMTAIPKGSLSSLEIKHARIEASMVADMLQGLSQNAQLKTLHLDYCGIDDQHVPALSNLLSFSSTKLETLSLKMNDLDGECIGKLAKQGLPHNQALKTLNLSYNPIGDDGARHLSDLLVSNITLESLSMVECDIWDDGCAQFISKLPHIKGLKQLIVDSQWESHDTLLLEAMQQNYTLTQLWTQRSAWLMKQDPAWQQIGFLLRLNAAKRRILVERDVPLSVLPKVFTSGDASSIFYLLTHQPSAIR